MRLFRPKSIPKSALLAGGLLLAGAAMTRAVAAQAFRSPTSSSTLRAGDALRITVWRHPELSGEVTVGTDGALLHPIYQDVQVVGMPVSAVRTRLETLLREYETSPRLVIEPLLHVVIGGQVPAPKVYMLPAGTTIADAVAGAGGATENGRLDRVTVSRGGTTIKLDLTRTDASLADMTVQSGDRIIIARRENRLRDVVGPVGSVLALAASVATLVLRY